MSNEIDALKKELAEAKARIEDLELSVSNLTLLLKKEMSDSGKLPGPRNSLGRFGSSPGSK